MHARILFLQHADGINGFNAVAPGFFLTCGNGKCQAVHNDVIVVKAPRLSDVLNQAGCNLDFLVGGTRLAFLINGQCHHSSPVLLN